MAVLEFVPAVRSEPGMVIEVSLPKESPAGRPSRDTKARAGRPCDRRNFRTSYSRS